MLILWALAHRVAMSGSLMELLCSKAAEPYMLIFWVLRLMTLKAAGQQAQCLWSTHCGSSKTQKDKRRELEV